MAGPRLVAAFHSIGWDGPHREQGISPAAWTTQDAGALITFNA